MIQYVEIFMHARGASFARERKLNLFAAQTVQKRRGIHGLGTFRRKFQNFQRARAAADEQRPAVGDADFPRSRGGSTGARAGGRGGAGGGAARPLSWCLPRLLPATRRELLP